MQIVNSKITFVNDYLQNNGDDCGLFVIFRMYYFYINEKFKSPTRDQFKILLQKIIENN